MSYVLPLFGEAWERRRRRRRLGLSAAAAAALVAAAASTMGAPQRVAPIPRHQSGIRLPPGTISKAPAALFSQAPYMGVACRVPNSIACERVGLAVWLKRPARSVVAWIGGRFVRLDWFGDERRIAPGRARRAFDGYLQPAGIVSDMHVRPAPGTQLWFGDQMPSPEVWLLIDYGRAPAVATHLPVWLQAGWG